MSVSSAALLGAGPWPALDPTASLQLAAAAAALAVQIPWLVVRVQMLRVATRAIYRDADITLSFGRRCALHVRHSSHRPSAAKPTTVHHAAIIPVDPVTVSADRADRRAHAHAAE